MEDLSLKLLIQNYHNYTPEDFKVWEILFDRQMALLKDRAADRFIQLIDSVKITAEKIPKIDDLNIRLKTITGWEMVVAQETIENEEFYELLSNRKFPAVCWLRGFETLDYIEEPDMFHDVFAHAPMLADKTYCAYLYGLSKIAKEFKNNPRALELLSRIYWYTVEFGLIRDNGLLRIYGAGILSSTSESIYCLKSGIPAKRIDYSVEEIITTPYFPDKFQQKYFVIDSCIELFESLPYIEFEIKKRIDYPLFII